MWWLCPLVLLEAFAADVVLVTLVMWSVCPERTLSEVMLLLFLSSSTLTPFFLSDGVERLTRSDDVGRRRRVLSGLLGLSTTSAAANGLLFFGGGCLLVAGGLASCHGAGRGRVAGPFEVYTQLGRIHFTPCAVKLEDGREGEAYGIGRVIPWDDTATELWVEGRDQICRYARDLGDAVEGDTMVCRIVVRSQRTTQLARIDAILAVIVHREGKPDEEGI